MRVYSAGYQGRSLKGLGEALVGAGVARLVDVRASAWSHRPEFRKGALRAGLAEAGVDYLHLKEAGNPFRPRKGDSMTLEECMVAYRRHLDDHPDVVASLKVLLREVPSALFCFEAHRSECHRGVLLERVAADDPAVEVVDV